MQIAVIFGMEEKLALLPAPVGFREEMFLNAIADRANSLTIKKL